MTPEQLHALRAYIVNRCEFIVEQRLNPSTYVDQWRIEQYEKKFEEIMLAPTSPKTPEGNGQ